MIELVKYGHFRAVIRKSINCKNNVCELSKLVLLQPKIISFHDDKF